MNTISLLSYAKINLCLNIKGKFQNGFHEIDTVMQSISLSDKITVSKTDDCNIGVRFDKKDIKGEQSIAYKAAELFFNETAIRSGADIVIKSGIPMCSGLGGGSADGAGVLTALNHLFGNLLTKKRLVEISAVLGADVPFCIVGGTARCMGTGSLIVPCSRDFERKNILLISCGTKQSTALMYDMLDKQSVLPHPDTDMVFRCITNGENSRALSFCGNSFSSCYDIEPFRKLTDEYGAEYFGLSGSGPYSFAVFKNSNSVQRCRSAFINKGFNSYLCQTVCSGNMIIE